MGVKTVAVLRPLWTIVWRSCLFLLVWGLLLAPLIVPLGPSLARWSHDFPLRVRLCGDLAGALTMLAATWLMVRFIDRRPFATIGLGFPHLFRDLVRGLATGSAWLALSIAGVWAAGCLSLRPGVTVSWPILAGAALSVALNVLAQELLLCGYVFQTIQAQSRPVIALVVSALLFAIYHAAAFQGAWLPPVNVFGAGLVFGLAYLSTRRLWFPIAIHFAWNFFLGPVLGLTVSGSSELDNGWQVFTVDGPARLTGGAFGLEGGLVVTMSTIVIIVALWLLARPLARWGKVAMP